MILINPASPNRMGMISRYAPASVPTGIGVLAGYLLSKGKQVKILDELTGPIDKELATIGNYLERLNRPYIFGISCLTINIGRGFKLAEFLKTKYPDSKVILGGIHPTALPEEALNMGYVDIVVRGEGEETLLELYDSIKNGRSLSDIKGISYKIGNAIRHNVARPLICDLDIVPCFPYKLFDCAKYNLGFVVTSRGCPYNCIFCSQRLISGRQYRFRSCERVIEEVDLLVNGLNQQNIAFLDDDFLINKNRVRTLCEAIVKNKFNLKTEFGCQTRADSVNQEVLDYLRRAGFTFIGLGLETGSERLMKLIDKKESVENNIKAVKLIKGMGFKVNASFLFALPTETVQERLKTYIIAKKLRLDYAKFNNVVPYPGTKLFEMAKKEGSLNIAKDWENFNSVGGVVEGIFAKSRLPYVPQNTSKASSEGIWFGQIFIFI
jgi:anaerobic magnesium-protoporphyrin IX monomethyl ester cyclase